MGEAPATATQVALRLGELSRDLDDTVKALEVADTTATERRGMADLAFSKAFLTAEGSVDARKHQAVISTHDLRMEADTADAVVRHLRRRLDAIKVQIDVGRSYSAAVRSEVALAQAGWTP